MAAVLRATALLRNAAPCVAAKRAQAATFAARPVRRAQLHSTVVRASYASEQKGPADSLEFRIFFKQQKDGAVVSPWHDIPLYAGDGLVNFICEIPKESAAKMEVATDETNTPIKQDIKKGKLRFYPYNINWNYGLLPQTWEDPAHKNDECDAAGDNDPVDVVEIGSTTCEMGGVYPVKPLGVYAMIDDGELDWKVIAIRADDPLAAKLNDVEDVERELPGELEKVLVWFRDYKMPDGKPANKFGYDNKCMNKEFAMEVIEETHSFYNRLRSGARANTKELSLV
ncbi:hypothetical protein CHLNCDRAFT_56094 [Chlorella variabilis]|uniref:inorganic diphosphatase n=1 Tax=Chlorella variabilis TaxID=554065 RepID=E1ZB67_CHLVA|nr:hypothetical protein CHLNCDRAFT_56094 [Chlorella variabilis]EFN57176.1 hypothetical protein CHLNCDRAFT_56094 [Chlorella variabilis]|eukprot:XP_005849278.1 hypothetical protein CHLNCDRAFT_56094 [Chlorella variabilis]